MSYIKSVNFQIIQDCNIAAALLQLGFLYEHSAIQVPKKNGKMQFVYFFKSQSEDGEYKLQDVIKSWGDKDYTKHNTDKLAEIKGFYEIRNLLLDDIKQGRGEMIKTNAHGMDAYINKYTTPEKVKELLED